MNHEEENNGFDLISELNKETQEVSNPTTIVIEDPKEELKDEGSDFDDSIKPESEEPEKKKSKSEYDEYKSSARTWIKAVNTLQKWALTEAYYKRMLKPGDVEKMQELSKKRSKNSKLKLEDAITEDDELFYVLQRFEKMEEKIKELPFDEEEQEELVEPLAKVIEKYKSMVLSPEGALLLAVIVVMTPRLEPLFPKLFNFFK